MIQRNWCVRLSLGTDRSRLSSGVEAGSWGIPDKASLIRSLSKILWDNKQPTTNVYIEDSATSCRHIHYNRIYKEKNELAKHACVQSWATHHT
eukprot:5652982-Pyramimonas_sp.AAC.1